MEMLQVMLKYPQVHTDMNFVNISTLPLEQRAGIETRNKGFHMDRDIEDGADLTPLSYKIRIEKKFPDWRKHQEIELISIQGSVQENISVDNITSFSVRPPELRHIFNSVGNYFRWFHVGKNGQGIIGE